MRRSAFLLATALAVGIAIAAIADTTSDCIANLEDIKDAKEAYETANNETPARITQLVPTHIATIPSCGDGGTYNINGPGANPTCTVDGHTLSE